MSKQLVNHYQDYLKNGGQKPSLRWAKLGGCDLSGCDLRGADLHWSNLRGCDLRGADLRGCDLHGCDLHGANLSECDLSECDLSECDLRGCDLRGCDLRGANLSESKGLEYSQCSFSHHGETGRQLLLVKIGGELVFFCGCFAGSPDDLGKYILNGEETMGKSRKLAMDFCLSAINFKS